MISGAITPLCSALLAWRRMTGSSVVTASASEVARRSVVVIVRGDRTHPAERCECLGLTDLVGSRLVGSDHAARRS